MADIHFPAYLQVSKDCLYHNTCVLFTALLTKIIFLQRILQECFLLPNHSRGDKEPSPVSRELLLWQKEKPFATTLFSQLHCEGLFLHKGGV